MNSTTLFQTCSDYAPKPLQVIAKYKSSSSSFYIRVVIIGAVLIIVISKHIKERNAKKYIYITHRISHTTTKEGYRKYKKTKTNENRSVRSELMGYQMIAILEVLDRLPLIL